MPNGGGQRQGLDRIWHAPIFLELGAINCTTQPSADVDIRFELARPTTQLEPGDSLRLSADSGPARQAEFVHRFCQRYGTAPCRMSIGIFPASGPVASLWLPA